MGPVNGLVESLCWCAAGCAVIIAAWLAAHIVKKREQRTIFLVWATDHLRRYPNEPDFMRRVAASLEERTYFNASVWKTKT